MTILAIFIAYPWLALVAGGIFALLWQWRRAWSAAAAAALWVGYGVYEHLILARVLCSGECNIRVDLLLFYPILLAAAVAALWNTARGGRRPT